MGEDPVYRYSGSKKRILKHLPTPPLGTTHIIEPFAGSLAYSLHHRPLNVTSAEANPLVRELLLWMRSDCSLPRLQELDEMRVKVNTQVAELGLPRPEETLMRLQTSGAYVGQLSSTIMYAQHAPRMSELWDDVLFLKASLRSVQPDYTDCKRWDGERGAMFFIDPPYAGTEANYRAKGRDFTTELHLGAVEDFILSLKSPALVTYGDGAQTVFPRLDWQKACVRKVPILRGGGTRDRTEWFAWVNRSADSV